MVELKCKRCEREWDYKGNKTWFTSCPDCKTSVKIKDVNVALDEGGKDDR